MEKKTGASLGKKCEALMKVSFHYEIVMEINRHFF